MMALTSLHDTEETIQAAVTEKSKARIQVRVVRLGQVFAQWRESRRWSQEAVRDCCQEGPGAG